MSAAVRETLPSARGDVLCFLPGAGEVRRAAQEVRASAEWHVWRRTATLSAGLLLALVGAADGERRGAGEAEAGLLLFYNHKAFVGVGFTPDTVKTYQYAEEQVWARLPHASRRVRVRLTNDRNVITYEYSYDEGRSWKLHPTRMEVSGIHHNVFGGFLSLKVGVYGAAKGSVLLSDFQYRGMDGSANL